MVLGSGLSVLADHLEDPVRVPYREIEGFPRSTVPGHAGNFVVGTLEGRRVGMAQGRFHLYEGYEAREVVLPVRVLHALGARALLVTAAARRPPQLRAP
jgi:purine-nucleoside phosphorylase